MAISLFSFFSWVKTSSFSFKWQAQLSIKPGSKGKKRACLNLKLITHRKRRIRLAAHQVPTLHNYTFTHQNVRKNSSSGFIYFLMTKKKSFRIDYNNSCCRVLICANIQVLNGKFLTEAWEVVVFSFLFFALLFHTKVDGESRLPTKGGSGVLQAKVLVLAGLKHTCYNYFLTVCQKSSLMYFPKHWTIPFKCIMSLCVYLLIYHTSYHTCYVGTNTLML